jgi:hypothetical protein
VIFLKLLNIFRIGITSAVVGVTLLGLGFCPTHTFLPYWSYWDATVFIEGSSSQRSSIGFIPRGSICIVKITVYSESTKIMLSLTDSSESAVYASILIDESHSLVFQAPKDEFYYLTFDSSSLVGLDYYWLDKEVSWQLCYYDHYNFILKISGVSSLVSGLVCVGLYRFRLKGLEKKLVAVKLV